MDYEIQNAIETILTKFAKEVSESYSIKEKMTALIDEVINEDSIVRNSAVKDKEYSDRYTDYGASYSVMLKDIRDRIENCNTDEERQNIMNSIPSNIDERMAKHVFLKAAHYIKKGDLEEGKALIDGFLLKHYCL